MEGDAMSTQQEHQFVEGAARAAYVMAWAAKEDTTCMFCHHEIESADQVCTHRNRANPDIRFLCHAGSFPGQRLEDIAPPTPDYAREWAWRLLGALEEANIGRGRSYLSTILAAAQKAECVAGSCNEFGHSVRWSPLDAQGRPTFTHDKCEIDARKFGSDIAMMALGTGVSWFDDHAQFELHVPEWYARGFELGD